MSGDYEDELHPDPGPGLVALVAITVARDDGTLENLERWLTPIEIRASGVDDLTLRVGRYAANAVKSIGDPGYGHIVSAREAARRTGVDEQAAARGVIFDRDAG
jgi:hypothetical protein